MTPSRSDAGMFEPICAIGLMSGTSGDGVDAALVQTDGETQFKFLDAITLPYESDCRERLLSIAQTAATIDTVADIEQKITEIHLQACQSLLERNTVTPQLIGFHGHTIRHDAERGITHQIGNASHLAMKLGCSVVSDFRRCDLANGGSGAPLAPLFHQQMLSRVPKPTAVLNLGGVANVTWLGTDQQILSGDTGPGCGLLDAWVLKKTGNLFDRDGLLSASGNVVDDIVERALDSSYFRLPLPKSADRFQFEFPEIEQLSIEDGAATLCAITVAAIASAASEFPETPDSLWVTGGGSHNPTMMRMLSAHFRDVRPIEEAGLRSDSLEAECFGWLAVRRLRGLPTSLPQTTGCSRPTCGGLLTP